MIAPIIQERISTLDDAPVIAGFFFQEVVQPDPQELVGKRMTPAESAQVSRLAYDILESAESMKVGVVEPPMRTLVEEIGLSAGQVFGILRIAITGQKVSPPLFESIEIIGKPKVLERVAHAIDILEAMQ